MASFVSRFDFTVFTFFVTAYEDGRKRKADDMMEARHQIVNLEESGETVRILGLTLDHGLLRTKRVVMNASGDWIEDGTVIDLQPNSNSFDMLSGLIKTKTS